MRNAGVISFAISATGSRDITIQFFADDLNFTFSLFALWGMNANHQGLQLPVMWLQSTQAKISRQEYVT
jgi:hypothetical protein